MIFSPFRFNTGLGFQSTASPIMEGIVDLHNHIFFFLILVFVFVFWMFGNILYNFWWKLSHPSTEQELEERVPLATLRHVSHSTSLEVIWTIIPSLILAAIAVPSLTLLYAMDEIMEPTLTLKVIGHQWYWTYQYSNCISQMHYSGLDHPELIPESLWNRAWSNASAFYTTYLASDDATQLAKFPLKPVPYLIEDWALEEACSKYSDFEWIDPIGMFSESYLKENNLSPEAVQIYPRAKLFALLREVRHLIPKPYVPGGFTAAELVEKGRRAELGLDLVDPERIPTEKLYAFLVNKFPNHKRPYVPSRFDLIRVHPYNPSTFVHTISFPNKLTFETFEGRLNGSIDSLLPVGYYDMKWWNEWWLRKVIAGKVVEALHLGVNLSGHADRLPGVQFDSYMLNEEELAVGDYRLLEVDEPIVLPTSTHIRLLITADDVIHSFAVPQLGIKVDAVPGRLNQQGVFIKRRGSFYGQCSELCGVNHGFMPIVVKAVSMKEFVQWYLHKFDSLYPEYGMKLADKEEVLAFLKGGAYPAAFAEFFPQDRLTVPESVVGDKSDSVFNLPHATSLAMNSMLGFIVDRFVHAHPGVLELNWGLVQFDKASTVQFSPMEGVLSGPEKVVKGPLMDWTNPMIYKRVVISDPASFIKGDGFVPSRWTLKSMKQIAASGSVDPLPVVTPSGK